MTEAKALIEISRAIQHLANGIWALVFISYV